MYCDQCGTHNRDDAQFCNRCGHDMHVQREQLRGVGTNSSSMPEVGDIIGNRYEVQKEIGRGGMGIVYKAHDRELDLQVALKVLHPRVADRPEAVSQLREEALAAMHLTHPNIVRLYNFEKRSDATYLLMEYVPGQSMGQMLNNGLADDLAEREVVELIRQLCEGLGAAHTAGVIHRDIKPSNLLMTPTGVLKIVDFGIARAQGMGGGDKGSTRSVGTPTYMAPEQYEGSAVDARTDIYAIGTTLYEILAGHPPFVGGDLKRKHLEDEPEPIADVSDWLNAIVQKCLAKNPKDRWQSARDLVAALSDKDHPALAGLVEHKETDRDPEWRRVARERKRREQMLKDEQNVPEPQDDSLPPVASPVRVAAAVKTPEPVSPLRVVTPKAPPTPKAPNSSHPGVKQAPALPVSSVAVARQSSSTGTRSTNYSRNKYQPPKAASEMSTFIWPPPAGILQFGVGAAFMTGFSTLLATYLLRAMEGDMPVVLLQTLVLGTIGLFWGMAELNSRKLLHLLGAGLAAGACTGALYVLREIAPDTNKLDVFFVELLRAGIGALCLSVALGFARESGLAGLLAAVCGGLLAGAGAMAVFALRTQEWMSSPYAGSTVSAFLFALSLSYGAAFGASIVRSTNPMRL